MLLHVVVISTKEQQPCQPVQDIFESKQGFERTVLRPQAWIYLLIHSWLFLDEKASFVRKAVEQKRMNINQSHLTVPLGQLFLIQLIIKLRA